MQAALKMMDVEEEYRREEMLKLAEEELNIDEFKVEPAANLCATDFFIPETPTVDDIEAYTCGDKFHGTPPAELPLHYYDNDDGFWDDYIKQKQSRWERAGMITNRKHFIH